jgi:hypothetical protein
MTNWNHSQYEQEKESFIRRRVKFAPLWGQFALLFAATWGAAWFCSWFLWRFFAPAHVWAQSLALRYAIAFLFAYACFFLAVRLWIEVAKKEPERQLDSASFDLVPYPADGEGCLLALALLAAGFVVVGLFMAAGGAPLLLEAAFEAAFAGVIVRRPIAGDLVLGGWKARLFANTWKQALAGLAALLAIAYVLHARAPQATTLAEAVRAILHAGR